MAEGGLAVAVEARGERPRAGVALNGRADRIDARDGALRIVDYNTGKPPTTRQLKAGFALQLGLIGWLADQGAFYPVLGTALRFDYWWLSGGSDNPGEVPLPTKGQTGDMLEPACFSTFVAGGSAGDSETDTPTRTDK